MPRSSSSSSPTTTSGRPTSSCPCWTVDRVQAEHSGFRVEQFGGASTTLALDETIGEDFKGGVHGAAGYARDPHRRLRRARRRGHPDAARPHRRHGRDRPALDPSHLFAMDEAANSVILLVGLAVGVDYTLFYLKREREERAADRARRPRSRPPPPSPAGPCSSPASRSSPPCPACSWAGRRRSGRRSGSARSHGRRDRDRRFADRAARDAFVARRPGRKGRIPFLGRRAQAAGGSRVWGAILDRVLARPLSRPSSAGLLVVLALPLLGMKTELTGINDLPRSLAIMQTYDRIQAEFPGGLPRRWPSRPRT